MTATVHQRVAAGAAWLDEHWPAWVDAVTQPIDMASGCGCVLGQVACDADTDGDGSYIDVAQSTATPRAPGHEPVLSAFGLTDPLTVAEATALGFHALGDGLDCWDIDDDRRLAAEWTRLIAARKTDGGHQ